MSHDENAKRARDGSGWLLQRRFTWHGTLLLLITGGLLAFLAQFVGPALWWLAFVPLFFAFLIHRDKHVTASHQFSLRGILLLTAVVGVWLALFVSRVGGGVRWFVILAPYFFVLYLARRFISGRFHLASTYLVIHSAACAITAALILREPDFVGKWALSLPIIFIDLPVSFPLAFWQPPGLLGPLYVFMVGGVFWATVGWHVARETKAEPLSFPTQPSLFRLSGSEEGVDQNI